MNSAMLKLSRASIAVLAIQLALVSSIALKYLYQRWMCPRIWTKTVGTDPVSLLRGNYLTLQLTVDGCESTLPSAKQAVFPRNVDGTVNPWPYDIAGLQPVRFPARLVVKNNKLVAIRIPATDDPPSGQMVSAFPGRSCDGMQLADPVSFYLPERAKNPIPVPAGAELWIEVTIPPTGPPRPLQLALKQNGAWKPLAFD